MYLGPDGKPLPKHREGPRAAGVPGTVAGLGLAHERYGKLPWSRLVEPAARLAREGFAVDERLARSLNSELFPDEKAREREQSIFLADFPETIAAYGKGDGSRWRNGDTLVLPELAGTLERIGREGWQEFYKGVTAQRIVACMGKSNGLITLEDLASYHAIERKPICVGYRGFDVYGMGPPSSGGITMALMLNMLERYDLKVDGPRSSRTVHRVAEVMRRAYFVRATELADPDFVPIAVQRLISKPFAVELGGSIRDDKATKSEILAPFPILGSEGEHTTHLSTMDAEGGAVALTYTLEDSFGARYAVPGAGFLLNNEMGDFNVVPGRTEVSGRIGTKPNLISPRKRMLSSQAPTIVLKGGRVRIVTGSPGGRTIPNTVLWVVLNLTEFGRTPEQAVAAMRTHHQWFPDRLLVEGLAAEPKLLEELEKLGHRVHSEAVQGDAHTIVVEDSGKRRGMPDPRRGGGSAAVD